MSQPISSARSPEQELGVEHLTADIGRRSKLGGAVLMAAQLVRVAGQLTTLVVLARLLAPEAFGLLAMVAAVGAILDLVKDFGLSAATIQKPDITHAQVSALFWINAVMGACLGLALFAVAPLLAKFYGQPDLEAVTRWLSLGFVASGFTVQHWALLRRQMRFFTIAGMETTADLMSFAAAIGLALAGAGYWALVVQRLVSPVMLAIASWLVCRWRPASPARATGLRALLGFGASVTASGMAIAFSRSIDQILIGWMWGPAVLGLYERTTRLLMLPINTINAPVYATAMPALSRLTDDPARYRAIFAQVMQKLGLLTMPTFALAAVTADWIVEILLGPAWLQAIPLVALFSLAAICLPLVLASGLLYMTQARTKEMLRGTLVDTGLCVASILGGLHWGVEGVAAALAIGALLLRLPVAFWLTTRRGPVSAGQLWRAIAPPASAAISVLLAVYLVRRVAPEPSAAAIAAVAAAALAAALLSLLLWPETRRELGALTRLPLRRLRTS
jgi:PST family polysaccharide transporter